MEIELAILSGNSFFLVKISGCFIYLFIYLLTLFNVDYKTLAAYVLIKID